MRITVYIDATSTTPHYEQLRSQLSALIRSGRLEDGERLPTVRALANDLGIAPGTVARAYRDLESAGLAITSRKVGTIVTAPPRTHARSRAAQAAHAFAHIATSCGVSDAEAHDLLSAALLRRRTNGEDTTGQSNAMCRSRPSQADATAVTDP